MLFKIFDIKDVRYLLFIAIIIGAGYVYTDWQEKIQELKRVNENQAAKIKLDSLKIAEVTYNKQEIEDYLTFENKDLKQKLLNNNIKLNRIEKIVTQKFQFRDTVKKITSLNPMVQSIRAGKPHTIPFIEKGKCFTVGGNIVYNGADSLDLQITERGYRDKLNNVTTWKRSTTRWLFGFKSTLFGHPIAKVNIFNDCGTIETLTIEAKKKKVK